eukprot:TRINITY_DN3135_c0_g2_i6.p2 TRINITY_DN3135_c0_g2~~TRINITY_DN3135_c0_g2_i6.p2  ORF type:complete len:190 (-),score=38.75 TRINITY_DN3135_c0_g2_i6:248-817(-)
MYYQLHRTQLFREEFGDFAYEIWEVGGQDKIRPLLRHYYENVTALIFVVDSNDRDRMSEAAQELHRMLAEDHLQGVPLLVFANKQDLPNACTPDDVSSALGLHQRDDWSEAGRSAFLLGTRCEHSVVSLMRGNQHLLEEIWRHVGTLTDVEISDFRPHAPWKTFGSCALSSDGLYEGLDWLSELVKPKA